MPNDAELLRRYADLGSEAAFAAIVERHLDLVYSAALRQVGGDMHRAQDVSQLVFALMARKARSLAGHPVLTGWLYTTTQNIAAKAMRAESRRRAREQEAYTMQTILAADTPGNIAADWDQVRPVLDAAMRELNARDREAVLLRFFARRPFAEIGAALQLSEDAARMRVERALDKLHGLLARRGVTSTSAALAGALVQHAVGAAPAGLASAVTLTGVGSTAAVAVFFQFMTTSKLTVSVAGVALLVVAIGTAVRENRTRQRAEEVLAAERATAIRLAENQQELQGRTADAEEALRETRAGPKSPNASVSPPPAVTPEPRSLAEAFRAGREFLAKHPEARELWLEEERAKLAERLRPIYRLLDLSPAQQEQIETTLLSSQSGYRTLATPEGMIAFEYQPTLAQQEAELRLQNALGADLAARFQELRRSGATFDFAAKLAGALHGGEALSPAQTTRMIQIFAASGPRGHGDQPDWKTITSEASLVLSPAQLSALAGVQQRYDYHEGVRGAQPVARSSPSSPAQNPASPVR